ncbi:MAG TPA: hypothetical protein VK808_06625 [Bacteroidia bacterium]|jgi:hypothetical protein|nr:hypothetical protein [Bacteroidia bacterium]
MLSKITHFIRYGVLGALAGGTLKIIGNWENPDFPLIPLLVWGAVGAVVGILYSMMIEKWFNETYHD